MEFNAKNARSITEESIKRIQKEKDKIVDKTIELIKEEAEKGHCSLTINYNLDDYTTKRLQDLGFLVRFITDSLHRFNSGDTATISW